VIIVIQHWRRGQAAPVPASPPPQISSEALERARRRADAETEEWGGR
jgi:hypothetical protein